MKKDYSDSIAAQMQATLASPEHLALFAQSTAEAKDSKDSSDSCMVDDQADDDKFKDQLKQLSDSAHSAPVAQTPPSSLKPPSRVEYRDANDDKDAPPGDAKGSGAPGDPMKFTPDPKFDVIKAKPPQAQKADDNNHVGIGAPKFDDKKLYNDKAHADDGSMADDDATLAFDTAIGNLLSASSALDAAGMIKSATLSLELAQFVVEAKKKMKDKKKLKKKKMDSGKSKSDSKKSDSKKSDSKKSDSKKSDSKSKK